MCSHIQRGQGYSCFSFDDNIVNLTCICACIHTFIVYAYVYIYIYILKHRPSQTRALAEDMTHRQIQREKEQTKMEEVLAAEELRHMDLIARKREAEVRAG